MAEENIQKLNIKKKKSGNSLYYGVVASTGELRSVHDVPRGLACGCICPSCGTRLEARQGTQKAHHFAHENNKDCLYGTEVSIYLAFYELLKKSKSFFIPDAVLSFNSYKEDEIVKRGCTVPLTHVEFHNDPVNYPPDLLCYSGENCFQIILNIEAYYDKSDYRIIKAYGKQRGIPVISIDLDNLDEVTSFDNLQRLIDAPSQKKWIFNRLVEEWDKRYRDLAVAPASFGHGQVCLAQKNQYNNVYSARIEDCIHCRYCYDHMQDQCCIAPSFINHIEDFRKPIEVREREFAKVNNLKPIKKITDYLCPQCGAPMKRRVGPNGVFAGCSNYPQCKGSRQVEQSTEQVIIPHKRRYKQF